MMTVVLITVTGLFLAYATMIIYYRQAWLSAPDFSAAGSGKTSSTKITVIIPARNEEANIGACLHSLSAQSLSPELFEILVVDDHSADATAAVVQQLSIPNVRLIGLQEHVRDPINSYKKKAIEVAIEQSKGRLIVTTDADCILPKQWLETIAAFYESHHPSFIAAPVNINPGNSFIGIFQSLDFMTLQGITGASVHKKIHSMCNGANLAYEKEAFEEVNGFKGIDTIASGDDMLLMHKIYLRNKNGVSFLKSKEAIVETAAEKTIRGFFNQRIRWASKADKYDDKRILPVLVVVYFFNLLMLVLPVISVFCNIQLSTFNIQLSTFQYWALIFLLKIIIELFFLFPVAGFFNQRKLLWWFPLMQPFHILYTVIAGFLGKFGKYRWKGRKVN